MKRLSGILLPNGEEEEVSPGLFVTRRTLVTGLGAMALCGLTGSNFAAARDTAVEGLSFEQFLAQANPVANKLVGDTSTAGQDRYLRSVAALASGLYGVPVPQKFNDTGQGQTPESYRIGFNPGGEVFRVLHWRLLPGAICRPHAHTYGNVVSIGIEGVARVRNYEVIGEPDYEFGGTFVVQQTVDQILTPGGVNLVSLQRNYIHGFVAGPDGARGLDITTPLKPRPAHATPYLAIGNKAVNEFQNTFEASWEIAG
jgi:hypothetical protein